MSITYSENHIYYILATLGHFQMQTLLAFPHLQLILHLENYFPHLDVYFRVITSHFADE